MDFSEITCLEICPKMNIFHIFMTPFYPLAHGAPMAPHVPAPCSTSNYNPSCVYAHNE